ncbi:MAG: sensor histidine kinase [Thiohalomonadales bacterium]
MAVPLLVALGFAGIYVEKMAHQSQYAVYQAARATQSSRILVEQVTIMERAARQYQVLGDKALFDAYIVAREKFQLTIDTLLSLSLSSKFREQLVELSLQEEALLTRLKTSKVGSKAGKHTSDKFTKLSLTAEKVLAGSHQIIDREVEVMYDLASSAQQLFVWFGLALIPGVIVIVLGFSFLIAKPIRQINRAIIDLGEGKFIEDVKVVGPKDLEFLGERLNWLRIRLAEVEQEKIKFLRHVSHELKTPLTAIREGTNLLSDGLVGELKPEQSEVVQILGTNTTQLQQLIEDLLNFSVVHLDQANLRHEMVDLPKLVGRVLRDQQLAIMSKEIQINAKIDGAAVMGDKEKLRVIFDNLLSNAVKYSPRLGVIDIGIHRIQKDITVDITDSGPGIHDWEKDRVFEAFYQGEAIAGGHIKGTGLGLSIAKDYVLAHGGKISVTDGQFGKGAHFSLRLPIGLTQEAS